MNRRLFIKNTAIMTTGIIATSLTGTSAMQKSARTIYKIINSSSSRLGILSLKSIINNNYQNYVSPFFILDEFGPMHLDNGFPFRVDAHPHAGIIPTTYLFKGNAHHRDSMGNDFQYNAGDFIHFTSGKGALHMEETGEELFENGGTFHGLQCWLNIPSHLKSAQPYANHIKKEDIAIYQTNDVTIRVILGDVFGVKSKLQLLMPVIYWHISLQKNSTLELPIDISQNAFIYLQSGQIVVNGNDLINDGQAVLFERNGSHIQIGANTPSEILVLGGQVNNESFVASGPFVLNNQNDLKQAYIDFQSGKFGDIEKTNGIRR